MREALKESLLLVSQFQLTGKPDGMAGREEGKEGRREGHLFLMCELMKNKEQIKVQQLKSCGS